MIHMLGSVWPTLFGKGGQQPPFRLTHTTILEKGNLFEDTNCTIACRLELAMSTVTTDHLQRSYMVFQWARGRMEPFA